MTTNASRGMTLIDVLVGTAIAVVVFLAIFGMLRLSELLANQAANTAAATAIANSQMEYIRSLSYDSVGTVGGIPAGLIPQNSTTTEDSVAYGVRTFIDYYDDPADGTAAADTNGITTDYKRVKITVSYAAHSGQKSVSIVSNVSPPGIETTTGGGTLKISVLNASSTALAGASVHITNSTASPSVDLTTYSDATGIIYLPGAMPATGYHVTVSKSGYSTAMTYDRDTNNQNPSPGHLTVTKNTTTTGTFAIDALATFTIRTFSPIVASTSADTFADSSHVTALTNTAVSGGALTLTPNGTGGYLSPGSARSTAIAPQYLATWTSASATLVAPAGTTALVRVGDGSGALLPDSVLAGNSAGFSTFPVNLSGVSTTTYPSLTLLASLSGSTATPQVADWTLSSTVGPVPLPNISFTLTGAKKTGSTGSGAPIYKTVVASSTDAAGQTPLTLEWDSYSIVIPGHTIVSPSPLAPFNVYPGTTASQSIILSP